MLVRHVMCTEVFSLQPDVSIMAALRALKRRRIRRAPILDPDGNLIGIVTERDLLAATPSTIAEIDAPADCVAYTRCVDEVAAKQVATAHPDDHIEDLAQLLLSKKIGGVPVLDHRKLVGMITESDVFRAIVGAAHLSDATRITVQRPQSPPAQSVLEIVESLQLELVGLTEYPGPGDREVIVTRVRGARAQDLGPTLTRAGWVLLDRRDAKTTLPNQV